MKVEQHFYASVAMPTMLELEQVLPMYQGSRRTVVRFTLCPQTDCARLSHKVVNHLSTLAQKKLQFHACFRTHLECEHGAARVSEARYPSDLDFKAFFPDDGVLAGKPPAVQLFLSTLELLLHDIGLTITRDKTEVAPACSPVQNFTLATSRAVLG